VIEKVLEIDRYIEGFLGLKEVRTINFSVAGGWMGLRGLRD